jgi:hypothetical protein
MTSKQSDHQGETNEYYASLAKEIYTAARKENWTAEKTKEMLSNPKEFERYLNRVSTLTRVPYLMLEAAIRHGLINHD